ncbi:MAG: 3-oxoacyl-ACP reductase FabG [Deltaproteobacteria bacterium]|nr:3-oxoacyl-ACP reductase FabG [Deltaproteobacteria bacterium]MBW2044746.1 3-oxoacyl-ACP reductase FabG [Deltaproteobacteria bacterium]MBW2301709.1 3-oxoacyl-ACP reductase FabG [Deltaproteobacteria bacterium]
MLLENRVAVVTGGAQGLGREDALVLAREGADIVVVDINKEGAHKTADEVEMLGRRSIVSAIDITDKGSIEDLADEVKEKLGGVDILINNAAMLNNLAQIEKMKDSLWERDLNVNLTGTYYCTKAFFPQMREKNWGRIINMASVAGTLGGFGQASYSTTKAGVIGFTKSIALEGARFGITCNAIVGGVFATEMTTAMPEDMQQRILKRIPMRKFGNPEDVANAIAFLVSEKASYITGAVLNVTGGIELFAF